ncbi:hypothetical protein BT63DRAFT_290930 [Microthyrium microscopicum]|uniref:Uncharacterized protein n=1 Tax=Microthyrium microscopicum TaxID=703497 RepID=A0A6A6U7G7_9PEZI|nr:hypothetical protein BT63DRAFT_290930 [Microthyrium microscopicum]
MYGILSCRNQHITISSSSIYSIFPPCPCPDLLCLLLTGRNMASRKPVVIRSAHQHAVAISASELGPLVADAKGNISHDAITTKQARRRDQIAVSESDLIIIECRGIDSIPAGNDCESDKH